MKTKVVAHLVFVVFMLCFLLCSCTHKRKEKFLINNNYTGFFAVIYKDDKEAERKMEGGYKIFKIYNNDVYQSGFDTPRGEIVQEFYYRNNHKIADVGSTQFSRLELPINSDKLQFMKKNINEKFVIYFYGGTNPDPNKSDGFSVFFVAKASDIIRLLDVREDIFRYLTQGYDFSWQINEAKLKDDIRKLNLQYLDRKPPFNQNN